MNKHITNIREKAGRHKVLIQNFSYLSALQVFNLLLPLITYPYLIRVLGKETYGLVVFAQAIIGYLLILVGFGFNISATKDVSIHRDNKEKLSEIVSSVLIIKSAFFILSLIILAIVLWFIPQAKGYEALFYLTMWMCLYDVLFPQWYFQGIERMKYITYITLVSRLIFLVLIFVFIHSPADYLFMPVISGIGAVIAGLVSLYIVFFIHKIKLAKQPLSVLKKYFKDSIPIFVSNVSVKIYVSTNKVIIGAFLGMAEVAYYDLAEKLITILKIPQSILSQTLFPKISKDRNVRFVMKIFWISIGFNFMLFLLTFLFSETIIRFIAGYEMLPALQVVRILTLTVPIIAGSNIFAIQLLIPFNHQNEVIRIVIVSLIFYLISIILLSAINQLNMINLSIVIVMVEIVVTIYSYIACKMFKIL